MNSLKNILIGIAHVKYSEDDWGNNYEVKTITSVEDQIVNYFTDYDFNAQFDIDRVSDYYLISKICQMESLKDKIIDNDIRVRFGEIINFCNAIKKQFPIRNLIAFYNNFSFDIESEYLRMRQAVYDDIPQYYGAIQENAYKKAILQCPHLIFEKFKDYKKVIKEYPSLVEIIFSDENIACYLSGPNSNFIAACVLAVNSTDIGDTVKLKIINAFKNEANNIINCQDIKVALQNQIRYKALIEFLYIIKDPEFSSVYRKKQKEVDEIVNEYLDQYGQKFSIPIPFQDIAKRLDNPNLSKAIKQVELSHVRDDKIKELSHFSVLARDISKDSILDDICCTAADTNENFKMSMQNSIASFHQFYIPMYRYYLGDTHFNDYTVMQRNFLKFIYDELRLNFLAITSQISAWENKVKEFIEEINKGNKPIDVAINCLEKTILLIERVLTDIYCRELEKRKVFYNARLLTLGSILKSDLKDNPLLEVLGEEHLKYLEYTLISNVDKNGLKVGLNLRNVCMHSAYDWDEFDIGNTMISIMILTGIVNALFLYYNKIVSLRYQNKVEKKKKIDSAIAKQEALLEELKLIECRNSEAFRELQEQTKKLNITTTILDLLKANGVKEEDIKVFLEKNKMGISSELQEMILNEMQKSKNYHEYINALKKYDIVHDQYVQKLLGYYSDILMDKKELFSKEYKFRTDDDEDILWDMFRVIMPVDDQAEMVSWFYSYREYYKFGLSYLVIRPFSKYRDDTIAELEFGNRLNELPHRSREVYYDIFDGQIDELRWLNLALCEEVEYRKKTLKEKPKQTNFEKIFEEAEKACSRLDMTAEEFIHKRFLPQQYARLEKRYADFRRKYKNVVVIEEDDPRPIREQIIDIFGEGPVPHFSNPEFRKKK